MDDKSDLRTLRHFWDEKRDLNRMIGADSALQAYPEIARAWVAYKDAEDNLSRLFKRYADD